MERRLEQEVDTLIRDETQNPIRRGKLKEFLMEEAGLSEGSAESKIQEYIRDGFIFELEDDKVKWTRA